MKSPAARVARAALAAALLVVSSAVARAQDTAPVPLDDPAYRYLDRLDELGLVDSAVMGQRPYSYREMARLTRGAREAAAGRVSGEQETALVQGLLASLEARVTHSAGALSVVADEALVAANANDAVRRVPPPAASPASPQATIDPLALRRLGDPAVRGKSVALELLQRAEPTSWLAFNGRERLELRDPSDPELPSRSASVLEGGMRLRWRNVAFMAGREQIGWGSGGTGGLFIAADAPALDQLSLASDHPFLLPSLLRYFGPVSGTLVLANLGPSDVRSQSKLLAYKLSARPTVNVELGATFENHFGGEGGRTSPFWYRVIDFMPMIDIFRRHNYVDTTHIFDVDSDKALGADVRWRIPQLGGTTVAAEMLMDDFDVHRLMSLLNYAASHALSVTIPRLGSPAWSLALSATHMGSLTYTHGALTQGMTTRGRLLGNELGPDAKAFGAELRWIPAASLRVALAAQSAIYSNTGYTAGYDINGRWFVTKVSSAPDELREQAIGSMAFSPSDATVLTMRAGLERTRNIMFTGGRRQSYVLDLALRVRP